ncbi:XRE family transcriptional regulator [Sorangium cellulosum]|uniref:XRE family transcriptional regulator n=1 Tax=Sorangium cellulosum TaxID=56 RepID=A0A2L0EVT8_SORCE|nr:helix-turn-helix transcriptional regulator [Sorangium cellulosum]AUX43423.1 XRE family transcriptional regulator [Sorangium cellulosum]
MTSAQRQVGDLLRAWRQRRRMSQLDLACEADISTRHLSFLETGRAQPSRDMVVLLAERLDVPLRDRNQLLVAAGYAPLYPERSLDDPALAAARRAVELVLAGHEPYPAIAIDRHWHLVAANGAIGPLLAGAAPDLLRPPVNVLRLSLHPAGIAPRIENLPEWRGHLLGRLRRQVEISGDPGLEKLLAELEVYPVADGSRRAEAARGHDHAPIAVPLRFRTEAGTLSFLSTTMVFGTPVDVTLSELAVESFFPADQATAEALRGSAHRCKAMS